MAPDQGTETADFYPQNTAFPPQPLPTQPQFNPQHQQDYKAQAAGFAQYPNAYGQPFQSYNTATHGFHPPPPQQQQQQQQQQQYYQQTPERVPENKGWSISKDVGHGLSVVLSIVGLGVSLSLIGTGSTGSLAAICSGPVFALALIWSGAELITRLVRKWKAGIHPGAHVALSLIIWLAGAILGAIESTLISYESGYTDDCWDYYSQSYDDDCEAEDEFHGKRGQFLGAAIITLVVTVLHFALFVGACIDTAKRNALARRPIMVVNGPPYWGPVAQGWQPMPQYNPPGTPRGEQKQASLEPGQGIPLQTRSPSPMMTSAAGPAVEPKGKEREGPEGVREFYGSAA